MTVPAGVLHFRRARVALGWQRGRVKDCFPDSTVSRAARWDEGFTFGDSAITVSRCSSSVRCRHRSRLGAQRAAGRSPRRHAGGGRVKVYCTESNVFGIWLSRRDPAERVLRHRAFEHYVVNELIPRIRYDCRTPQIRLWTAGTSIGAFYTASFVLKRPDLFEYGLCLSGRYDATWLTEGYDSPEVFLSNPAAFTRHLRVAPRAVCAAAAPPDLIEAKVLGRVRTSSHATVRRGARQPRHRHRLELWSDAAHD